ncbi:MAG: DUF1848 domain-containing protein [Clostridia bacterium]|nr:DUF1848 domain-containing protein [Clostridia bacterium]
MILQTGQRTDIPAFYTPWFLNRLREGMVCVRNPFQPESVTRYRISPDVVDLIAFCTKNPLPMLPHLDLLSPYGQYWFITITPYGNDMEPNVPPKKVVMEAFRILSRHVGAHRIGWRYDPILLTERYTPEFHLKAFEEMAQTLSGYTDTVVISFVDLYEKVKSNFPALRIVPMEQRRILGEKMVKIARDCGMTLRPCAEGQWLGAYGADCSGCMTLKTFERALQTRLLLPSYAKRENRAACACLLTNDIGSYNTCGHLCRYCYANASPDVIRSNMAHHDPASPLLIGHLHPTDTIHDARQESWIDPQLSFLPYF